MPLYTFDLRDGSCGIADTVGVSFADRDQALCYAHDVIRELMGRCERETRTWRLDVYEDHDRRVFQIPFARLDETLNHLSPHWRRRIEDMCTRSLSLRETFSAARATMRESQALVARSRGKPYLAAEGGHRIIREDDEVDSGRGGQRRMAAVEI
jgi:hypothetical protein